METVTRNEKYETPQTLAELIQIEPFVELILNETGSLKNGPRGQVLDRVYHLGYLHSRAPGTSSPAASVLSDAGQRLRRLSTHLGH